jgi:short-subunit dehydrogenase
MTKPICTIVGMGPGVSYSVAKKFGENGFGIAMVARDLKKLTKLELELKDEGVEAHSFIADASDENSLKAAFANIKSEIGNTDVLVYNAAVLKQGNLLITPTDEILNDFKVNVAGAITSIQQVAPNMKNSKQGTIILTGGGLAITPYPAYFSLAIGKAGIRNLTFSVAGELEPFGIKVGTVTICGLVKEGTKFDPKHIAEEYWKIYSQKGGTRQREIVFQ